MRALLATSLIALLCATAGCGGDDPEPTTAPKPAAEKPEPDRDPGPPPVGDGSGAVALEKVGDFEQPVYVTQPPSGDDALYVVEQCGRILRVEDGAEPETFLDISDEVTCGGEQGLLSVAFSPDYEDSGLLYVNGTDLAGDSRTVEFRRSRGDPDTADPDSYRELLRIEDKYPNHNGGLLLFGPDDRLYLGTGDGGSAGDPDRTAQDLESPLGKILEIDTEQRGRYRVAAYGLRNPWRFSFDRETGDVWIGDVGQDSLEEVDAVKPETGKPPNFGWSAFEGTERFNEDQEAPGHVEPVLTYGRDGGCSITGGYVVRDPGLRSLYGRYLYGDFCEGELRSFTAETGRPASDDRELGVNVPSLSSFGEDAGGRVYATSLDGPVYRLAPSG